MSEQMTPAEMRARAHSLRAATNEAGRRGIDTRDLELVVFIRNVRAGADALDRLADVIEHAERIAGSNRADSPYPFERYAHEDAIRTLAVARGDTTNHVLDEEPEDGLDDCAACDAPLASCARDAACCADCTHGPNFAPANHENRSE